MLWFQQMPWTRARRFKSYFLKLTPQLSSGLSFCPLSTVETARISPSRPSTAGNNTHFCLPLPDRTFFFLSVFENVNSSVVNTQCCTSFGCTIQQSTIQAELSLNFNYLETDKYKSKNPRGNASKPHSAAPLNFYTMIKLDLSLGYKVASICAKQEM